MPNVNIFISYRRDDAAGHAGRLCDRLEEHFPGCVFMDVNSIAPGTNFVRALEQKLAACHVLIVVVGKSWLSIMREREKDTERDDHARIEVATALRKGTPIIPVLVQGAPMPLRKELPDDLKGLADHNAMHITEPDFRDDVRRLAEAIGRSYAPQPTPPRPRREPDAVLTPPPPRAGVPLWLKLFVGLGAAVVVAVFAIFGIIAASVSSADSGHQQQQTAFDAPAGGRTLDSTATAGQKKPPARTAAAPQDDPQGPSQQADAFQPAGTWLVTVQTANGPLNGTYHLYPNYQMEFAAGAVQGRGTWQYDGEESALVITGMNSLGIGFRDVFVIGDRQGGAYQVSSTGGPGTMRRVQ